MNASSGNQYFVFLFERPSDDKKTNYAIFNIEKLKEILNNEIFK